MKRVTRGSCDGVVGSGTQTQGRCDREHLPGNTLVSFERDTCIARESPCGVVGGACPQVTVTTHPETVFAVPPPLWQSS